MQVHANDWVQAFAIQHVSARPSNTTQSQSQYIRKWVQGVAWLSVWAVAFPSLHWVQFENSRTGLESRWVSCVVSAFSQLACDRFLSRRVLFSLRCICDKSVARIRAVSSDSFVQFFFHTNWIPMASVTLLSQYSHAFVPIEVIDWVVVPSS